MAVHIPTYPIDTRYSPRHVARLGRNAQELLLRNGYMTPEVLQGALGINSQELIQLGRWLQRKGFAHKMFADTETSPGVGMVGAEHEVRWMPALRLHYLDAVTGVSLVAELNATLGQYLGIDGSPVALQWLHGTPQRVALAAGH